MGKLTVTAAKNASEPGKYGDGDGLFLLVRASGAKSWILRTMVHKRRVDIGLGGYPMIGLGEAREKAAELRKIARTGGDPLEDRQAEPLTFEEAVTRFHAVISKSFTSKNHIRQWLQIFKNHAFPIIGKKQLVAIRSGDIMRVLEPIWLDKPVTARNLKIRIAKFFDWAFHSDLYKLPNPAKTIQVAMPKAGDETKHHSSMAWQDVPAFFAGIEHPILKFLILTCMRSGEVRGAKWSEIDMTEKVWTVPKERMKMKREHRVPLTEQMLTILEGQRGLSKDFVFPSMKLRNAAPVSAHFMPRMLEGTGVTVHGFRSSFRTWVQDNGLDEMLAEAVLAHVKTNRTERAYARSDLFERRRELMEKWAAYVTGEPSQ